MVRRLERRARDQPAVRRQHAGDELQRGNLEGRVVVQLQKHRREGADEAGAAELADGLVRVRLAEYVFRAAAEHSDVGIEEIGRRIVQAPHLSAYLTFVVGMCGRGVLPDPVPDAAALGIVVWCWRNNNAVEDWHLNSDVLMARASIAATKAVLPHVDPDEGVDWAEVERALTDDAWTVPNGLIVAALFGDGWPEVGRTVTEQVRQWRRVHTDVLSPMRRCGC